VAHGRGQVAGQHQAPPQRGDGLAHDHLTPVVIVVVLGAGLLHASWNAIVKYISDGLVAFALIGLAATVCGGAMLLVTGLPDGEAIPFAVASPRSTSPTSSP